MARLWKQFADDNLSKEVREKQKTHLVRTVTLPLHDAIRDDDIEAVVDILNASADDINKKNEHGQTSAHLCAKYSNKEMMELLISNGAQLDLTTPTGNNVLHFAVWSHQREIVSLVMNKHRRLALKPNKNGKSPVDIAIEKRKKDVLRALFELDKVERVWNKIYSERNFNVKEFYMDRLQWDEFYYRFNELIVSVPDVAYEILGYYMLPCGKSIEESEAMNGSGDSLHLKFDFSLFRFRKKRKTSRERTLTVDPILVMKDNERVKLLEHPVTKTIISLRWDKVKWFYNFTVICNILLAISLSNYIVRTKRTINIYEHNFMEKTEQCQYVSNGFSFTCILFYTTFILFSICAFFEVLQIFANWRTYFKGIYSWIKLLFYFTFIFSFLMKFIYVHLKDKSSIIDSIWWSVNCLNVFQVWINICLYLRLSQSMGIYVIMFEEVVITFVRLLIPLAILLTAFTSSFYCLYSSISQISGYAELYTSYFKTMQIMVGGVSPSDTGLIAEGYVFTVRVFLYALFIVTTTILMANMLTGVALGNIEAVEEKAVLITVSMQTDFCTLIEGIPGLQFSRPKNTVINFIEAQEPFFLTRIEHVIYGIPNLSQKNIVKQISLYHLSHYAQHVAAHQEADDEDTYQSSIDQKLQDILESVRREFETLRSTQTSIQVQIKKQESKIQSNAEINSGKFDRKWQKMLLDIRDKMEYDRLQAIIAQQAIAIENNKRQKEGDAAILRSFGTQWSAYQIDKLRSMRKKLMIPPEELQYQIDDLRNQRNKQLQEIAELRRQLRRSDVDPFAIDIDEVVDNWSEEDEMFCALQNIKQTFALNEEYIKYLRTV